MTDARDDTEPRNLTPSELDHTRLPDQTIYKVALDAASHFEQGQADVQTFPLFITNEFKLLYFEMAPGATID